jgi:hypothetical protein
LHEPRAARDSLARALQAGARHPDALWLKPRLRGPR